jgi:hypothetical protein
VGSPIPHEVSDELKRVVERWHQLPLDRALSRMPSVRVLVQSLAERVAGSQGAPARQVPDLGPAAVMDQLTVMVHDLYRARPGADPTAVAEELAGIRRVL